jgi:hypothetical protein
LSAEAPSSASARQGFPRASDGQSGPTSAAGPATAGPTDAALNPEAIADWIRGFVRDNPGYTLKSMMSRLVCVFHAKVDTDSTASWTPIPGQAGRLK